MLLWGRYDFSISYLLHIPDYGHLISLSVLKIFLSTIRPWIHFLCDIDTLNYVCDFLYDFMWSFIIIFKFVYACHFFLSNLDFVEPLGVFAAICHLNECLAFNMLIYMCRSCFLKFFVIKFHSKLFFRNFFFDAPFFNYMLMILYIVWIGYLFFESSTYLGSILALVLCIRHNEYVI